MTELEFLIDKLELQPHPEGGYFKESYRSKGFIKQKHLDTHFIGDRNYCTAIYFLLTSDLFSAFHRINQDEIWHFYKGSPIRLHIISEKGNYSQVIIGNNIDNNESPQYVVSAKDWFAAELVNENDYALLGCTVSPGFDFKDFVLPKRETLLLKFPQHEKIITKLTHN
jgi:predicted cupin superfamily sugar epimerase